MTVDHFYQKPFGKKYSYGFNNFSHTFDLIRLKMLLVSMISFNIAFGDLPFHPHSSPFFYIIQIVFSHLLCHGITWISFELMNLCESEQSDNINKWIQAISYTLHSRVSIFYLHHRNCVRNVNTIQPVLVGFIFHVTVFILSITTNIALNTIPFQFRMALCVWYVCSLHINIICTCAYVCNIWMRLFTAQIMLHFSISIPIPIWQLILG